MEEADNLISAHNGVYVKEGPFVSADAGREFLLQITSLEEGRPQGQWIHPALREPVIFSDWGDALLKLDAVLEGKRPSPSIRTRSFFSAGGKRGAAVNSSGRTSGGNREKMAKPLSFLIRIYYRQNASWQGEIVWAREGRKRCFRSALELLHLLDEAVGGQEK